MVEELVSAGAKELGIDLPERATNLFRKYYDLLSRRNQEFNLTTIEGEAQTSRLHFLDSIAPLTVWDFQKKSVLDIGTGAGFPGIPMLIAEPTITLTLIEATEKKTAFLREVCNELVLEVRCLNDRAEHLATLLEYREQFDAVVSRAVAHMNILVELCLPYVKPGGRFFALKSEESDEEIKEAEHAIQVLGGKLENVHELILPGTSIKRRIIEVLKTANTDSRYPRRYARIQKAPL